MRISIKECFDNCKCSGGRTSIKDLLYFENLDIEESCVWCMEKGTNKGGYKVKYIVMGVTDNDK